MATTLVDSNVILDVVTEDSEWQEWSAAALAERTNVSRLAIDPIIYAEVAARFARIEDLEDALPHSYYERLPLPWEAAYLAGQCFVKYRKRGGVRHSPLPDFYIGAHAVISGMTLLTRDPKRYRTYFPALRVIAP